MGMPVSDQNLVKRAQLGERPAFDTLIGRYRERVMMVSLRYVRNRADAEDAVQDALTKVFLGLSSFRGECAFYTWLYRIAVNCAQAVLARRRRESIYLVAERKSLESRGVASVAASDVDTPADLALTAELCATISNAIDALATEQRLALMMYEYDGLSYPQVAAAMSCPVGTVRSRVSRARDAVDGQVRRHLQDDVGRARRSSPRVRPAVCAECCV